MADFVAVIRRAVDGLTDNTPDMRARVYEKAKGAVVRQLENMKPAPPEAMFKRQLDKLDEAIRQVEEEHAEAMAPEPVEEQSAAPASEPEHEPEQQKIEASETVPAYAEPVRIESEPAVDAHHPDSAIHQPSETDTVAGWEAEPAQPEYTDVSAAPPKPVEPVADDDVAHEPESARTETYRSESADVEPQSDHDVGQHAATAGPQGSHSSMPEWPVEVDSELEAMPDPVLAAPVTAPVEHQAQVPDTEHELPPMPKVGMNEADVAAGFNSFVREELSRPIVAPPTRNPDDFSWDAPFDDLPDLPKPVAFEEALETKQNEIALAPTRKEKRRERNARAELEDLIGFEPSTAGEAPTADGRLPPEVSRAMSKLEGKSFKVSPDKPRRGNTVMLALGVVGALVVAGGAFGFWQYQTEVKNLVASLMPSDAAKPADSKPVVADTTKSAETAKPVEAKPETVAVASEKPVADPTTTAAKPTEVASLDPAPVKFTERLLPDGTEATTDTAQLSVDANLKEGKTVAGQTKASTDVASTDTTAPITAEKPAVDTPVLAATQKMFLYEERLGQSSPVAVAGTVAWTLKNDTTAASGKPEPIIEAKLDIPERKITALITFKRNTDTSLPASHIVEIVFDLPEGFAEGNIESIQRIAFKQTEQDPGNALIAVPAKITEDFHMIALNDDADARKSNIDLMKTRSWIDIPLVYDNGRRALITIEKGATGTDAFDKALTEWAALGAQAATTP